MSMADDSTLRSHRSNEPFRRNARGSGFGEPASESDPLAELARLIGQPDPFADFGLGNTRPDARERQQPQRKAPSPMDWRKAAASMPAYETLSEETVRRQPAPRSEPHFAPGHPRFVGRDRHEMSPEDEEPLDPRHEAAPAQGHYRREPQFAEAEQFRSRRDERAYAASGRELRVQEPYFEDGAPVAQDDEETYDDPPRKRRHSGLLTAATLIGCAMIGTAGAYGYRTYYVTPGATKAPPVITAESTPSKVVSAGDMPTGKIIQDRVRDPGQNERLVSREEQPVEIRPPATTAPRGVLPAPAGPSSGFPPPPSSVPSRSGTPGAAAPANGVNEPKRVRTVTIRPDGTDVTGTPVGGAGQPGGPAAGAPPGRSVPAAKSGQPARSTGPLSLDPQVSASAQPASAPQPAPAPRERVTALPQPATPDPPLQPPAPRATAAPSNAATGGYLVQLSSQRSEAEAQASYRALQTKYPDQLGDRTAIVKRVDLGDKGIYYRALVGPFGSSGEAGQFCADFKVSGGQCLVQRN